MFELIVFYFYPMKTLGTLRQQYLSELATIYDQDEILSLFNIVTEHLLGYSRTQVSMNLQTDFNDNTTAEFEKFLQQLKSGRPVQHIIGKAPFYGLEFIVSEGHADSKTQKLKNWSILSSRKIIHLRSFR
jgi:methylase of polypeptide subunit release factors